MSSSSPTPAFNNALASALGNKNKQYIDLQFPLDLGWYNQQPCTTFQTLQHRKERTGFWHEYIVLQLDDGSLWRFERMGDRYARIEALGPHGTAAHDIAQCFRPEEISEAHLERSDVIAEITFPETLDLIDVLRVCRAIQEGEKTCSYTLLSSNCYFFCLAIQACLTRLVADWRVEDPSGDWVSALKNAPDLLFGASPSFNSQSAFLLHIYSMFPIPAWPFEELTTVTRKASDAAVLLPRVNQEISKELWYTGLEDRVDLVCEDIAKDGVVYALSQDAKHLRSGPLGLEPGDTSDDPCPSIVHSCKDLLARLAL